MGNSPRTCGVLSYEELYNNMVGWAIPKSLQEVHLLISSYSDKFHRLDCITGIQYTHN